MVKTAFCPEIIWSICCVPSSPLGPRDSALNKSGKISALTALIIPLGGSGAENQQISVWKEQRRNPEKGRWAKSRREGGHAIFDGSLSWVDPWVMEKKPLYRVQENMSSHSGTSRSPEELKPKVNKREWWAMKAERRGGQVMQDGRPRLMIFWMWWSSLEDVEQKWHDQLCMFFLKKSEFKNRTKFFPKSPFHYQSSASTNLLKTENVTVAFFLVWKKFLWNNTLIWKILKELKMQTQGI